jgi:hypothetical protein
MEQLLYKYRGLQNFKFFVDILLKNRLYASKYTELNDPMEGQYLYRTGELNRSVLSKLKGEKDNLYLCSLSRKCDNELMWSHYADGHRGVAIGVLIDRKEYEVRPIQYTGPAYVRNENLDDDTPIEILSHKLNIWSYEEEERVFVRSKLFVDLQIKRLITGRAMSNQDYSFIKQLVETINPEIEIIKADSFM